MRSFVVIAGTSLLTVLEFGAKSHPEVVKYTPDGQCLVTGSVDGFIEVWDPISAKLKALPYQVRQDPVWQPCKSGILSLKFHIYFTLTLR